MKTVFLSVILGFFSHSLFAEISNSPNIIVIMTDQERHVRHWPKGWAEKKPSFTS